MKIRIKFSKQGSVKYIGHLDTMRYFQKAIRRADVDIRYSEGFSPHQIMSFAAPLGVGITGSGEYFDIDVLSTGFSKEMIKRLNDTMADGFEVLEYKKLPDDAANAMSLVAACDYTVTLRDDYDNGLGLDDEEFFAFADGYLEDGDLHIVKETKKGTREVDLKPLIFEHRITDSGCGLFLRVSSGSTDNVKPEQVLTAVCVGLGVDYPKFAFRINRDEVYARSGDGNFVTLGSFGDDIE